MTQQQEKAFCVKCKANVQVKDPQLTKSKNGRDMLKGGCGACGTKVNRFLPTKK